MSLQHIPPFSCSVDSINLHKPLLRKPLLRFLHMNHSLAPFYNPIRIPPHGHNGRLDNFAYLDLLIVELFFAEDIHALLDLGSEEFLGRHIGGMFVEGNLGCETVAAEKLGSYISSVLGVLATFEAVVGRKGRKENHDVLVRWRGLSLLP